MQTIYKPSAHLEFEAGYIIKEQTGLSPSECRDLLLATFDNIDGVRVDKEDPSYWRYGFTALAAFDENFPLEVRYRLGAMYSRNTDKTPVPPKLSCKTPGKTAARMEIEVEVLDNTCLQDAFDEVIAQVIAHDPKYTGQVQGKQIKDDFYAAGVGAAVGAFYPVTQRLMYNNILVEVTYEACSDMVYALNPANLEEVLAKYWEGEFEVKGIELLKDDQTLTQEQVDEIAEFAIGQLTGEFDQSADMKRNKSSKVERVTSITRQADIIPSTTEILSEDIPAQCRNLDDFLARGKHSPLIADATREMIGELGFDKLYEPKGLS